MSTGADRPLSALLSQALVAYTVELDNQFELRMGEHGYPGARLSLVVWLNLMRFVADHRADDGISVGDLAQQALAGREHIKLQLGCLERWGFVGLFSGPDRGMDQAARDRLHDDWGSGRGVRADWMVRPTPSGRKAIATWRPLMGEIEARWQTRFGTKEIRRLRESLESAAGRLEIELPQGLPAGLQTGPVETYPENSRDARATPGAEPLALAALLSRVLLAFRLEFDREADTGLGLCANTIRVIGEKPVRLADIPSLTGCSPEVSAIGWQLKPYVAVEADPAAGRGKLARLTLRGLEAQRTYFRLTGEIEKRWEIRFGKQEIRVLRESLGELFSPRLDGKPKVTEGLIPPPGVVRSGDIAPALGRRTVAAAARKRMRDLAAQSAAFVRDPAGALPHYPLWDFNRGFGP